MTTSCPYSFEELVTEVVPQRLAQLRERMLTPIKLADFAADGAGVRRLLSRFGHSADFAGLYLIVDGERPIYCGISRGIFGRLRQHVRGRTHSDGSLPYLIARGTRLLQKRSRAMAMKDADFLGAFEDAKRYLATCSVAVLEVRDPTERQLLEVAVALTFRCPLNSFETH